MPGQVIVRPNNPNNTHHISWSALGRTYGIKLERGAKSVVEAPVSPSNIERGGGVKRYGDFDPSFAHIEMRTWEGGRGGEFLSDDPTKYFDGYGWSLTPGMWYQAPQWWWGEFRRESTEKVETSGVSSDNASDVYMPGSHGSSAQFSMLWHSMATTIHIARSFLQQGSSYTMSNVQTWIRRIGTPPTDLRIRIVSSDDGGVGPALESTNTFTVLTAASVEELESFVWTAALTTALAQTTAVGGSSARNWWVEVYTATAGTDANHWEIGYNSSGLTASSVAIGVGTTAGWASDSTLNFYFRVVPAGLDRKWHFFTMNRSLYAIEEKADGTSDTRLFINGDRGIQSSADADAGTTAVLNDSSKAWIDNQWIGARIGFIGGPGDGESALITDNGSTSITANHPTAPTSLTEYYIYDTLIWTEISSAVVSSIGSNPVRDVTVGNGIAYFAFGNVDSTFIGSLTWLTSLHASDKQSTYFADVIDFFSDPTIGPQIVRAISSLGQVTAADVQGFTTVLTFSTVVANTGGTEYPFTNLEDYNNQMYAFKEDSIWTIRGNRAEKLNIGLEAFPSSFNGQTVAAQNLFLFFPWSHSVERLKGGVIDDIGLWRGSGLTPGHQGPVASLVPYIAWTLGGVDAGSTGVSGAYAWNGRGWHEFFRANPEHRLQSMYMQNNPGTNPRLWMSVGGEIVCQRWPNNTLNPRNDGNIHYQHEAVFQTGIIDMNAVQIPKLFSKVFTITRNLASTQARIYIEYQLDDDINSTNWLPIGNTRRSPIDSLTIRRGNKHSIRLRYRGLTENSTIHTELHATVLKAVGRTPVRRQWTVRAITGDFQVDRQGLDDSDPDDFYMWLQDVAVSAEPILQRAEWEAMDDIYVFAEHPILNRLYTTPDGQWGGNLQLTVREIEDD